MRASILAACMVLWIVQACRGDTEWTDGDGDTDADVDGDVDGDGDIDADIDADVDADSDGDPPMDRCPALPAPEGSVVRVSNAGELHSALESAGSGTTVLLADGTYNLEYDMWLGTRDVTVRGESGARDRVILDCTANDVYIPFSVAADDITFADLTIRNAGEHAIHVIAMEDGGIDRFTAYNVVLFDSGAQPLKVSNTEHDNTTRDGLVACSRIGYTSNSPSDYTNGFSMHNGADWVIRDNVFERVRGPGGGEAGPTILIWSGSRDTIIERNVLIDCYRGIALGNPSHGPGDHFGGVIRNNFIAMTEHNDSGMELVNSTGFVVAYNTILITGASDSSVSIYTYGDVSGEVSFNLSNMGVMLSGVTERGNVTNAAAGWFVNAGAGDLHLSDAAGSAIDAGEHMPEVTDDIDGQPRTGTPDVGADER